MMQQSLQHAAVCCQCRRNKPSWAALCPSDARLILGLHSLGSARPNQTSTGEEQVRYQVQAAHLQEDSVLPNSWVVDVSDNLGLPSPDQGGVAHAGAVHAQSCAPRAAANDSHGGGFIREGSTRGLLIGHPIER